MRIKRAELEKLVETHFLSDIKCGDYELNLIEPKKLLTSTRFDLGFKLLYLDMLEKNESFAKALYKEHIRALSLGLYSEPGQKDKNTIEKFYSAFDDTYKSVKAVGFDRSKSLIPISANGSIANGAHRLASAVKLGKAVYCVQLGSADHIYDYKFFYRRNVSTALLDAAATKLVEYAENLYIALVWPTAEGKDAEIEKSIPDILYRKNIKLNITGAHNFLSQVYSGESWLGSVDNNYRGVKGKLSECFQTFNFVRVIVFRANALDKVLGIKKHVRAMFGVGKHSIHITDTKKEALAIARLVFNDNSLHFLNYARPSKYKSTYIKLSAFQKVLDSNGIDLQDALLDGGIILSAYGLREASDIDYFLAESARSHNELFMNSSGQELQHHDEELEYHDEHKNDLIYNPKFYFYFNNIKFIAFNQLYRMKKNRNEIKDQNDCNVMEALDEGNRYKKIISTLQQSVLYWHIKMINNIKKILVTVGLYGPVRNLYKSIAR